MRTLNPLSNEKGDSYKTRFDLYFKKDCNNNSEKPLILSTPWRWEGNKQDQVVKNVSMKIQEDPVAGGKKNRKSRRKSKRTKKTAKRVR